LTVDSKYNDALAGRDHHIQTLKKALIGLSLVCAYLIYALKSTQTELLVHVPPDLSAGASLKVGELPKANVYAFGFYIWQQLNRWPSDGAVQYPKKQQDLACYLTASFRETLEKDAIKKGAMGELSQRERGMQEIPGRGYKEERVFVESKGAWQVFLDLEVRESVRGESVKQTFVRYPMRVVKYPVDPECNPWGLALDGFVEEPQRLVLTAAELATPSTSTPAQSQ